MITHVQEPEMHWSEQLKLQVKQTEPRPPREQGDRDNRIDYDKE